MAPSLAEPSFLPVKEMAIMMGYAVLYLAACYLLGGVLTGVWVVRALGGPALRQAGSGNPGARNAGRVRGPLAFVLTFLGDALKGAAAVGLAPWFGDGPSYPLLALTAVLLGHLFPPCHAFRGGKGVSAFCGGAFAYDWRVWLCMAVLLLTMLLITRRMTPSGLTGIAAFPLFVAAEGTEVPAIGLAAAAVLLILTAHRDQRLARTNDRR